MNRIYAGCGGKKGGCNILLYYIYIMLLLSKKGS